MAHDPDRYWEERGRRGFTYRGERFYTKTPIGFYWRRRAWLLARLGSAVAALPAGARVLDFGCGDGFYARWIARRRPDLEVYGCDISSSMIERAKQAARDEATSSTFEQTPGPIPFAGSFDLILVVAVLAHVPDGDAVEAVAADLGHRLDRAGRLLVFEMTARRARSGEGWRQPEASFYRDLFARHELACRSERLAAFPTYQWFGRFVVHGAGLFLHGGAPIRANGDPFFQRLSVRMADPVPGLDPLIPCRRGNTLYEFRKP